jgi:hypothetical protein
VLLRCDKPEQFQDERSDVPAVSSGRACLDHALPLDHAHPLDHALPLDYADPSTIASPNSQKENYRS